MLYIIDIEPPLNIQGWLKASKKRHLFLFTHAHLYQDNADPQIEQFFLDDLNNESLLKLLAQLFAAANVAVLSSPKYENIKNEIMTSHTYSNMCLSEAISYEDAYFQNAYRNLSSLGSSYHIRSCKGAFKGLPAIICGAGPSLDDDLSCLETLTDRALCFAGGSAANALGTLVEKMHFFLTVDPNITQAYRAYQSLLFSVPVCYQLRVNEHALRSLHGPKLYFEGEKDALFLGESHSEAYSSSFSVMEWAAHLAATMGCNPIILLGMDLSYKKDKHYAQLVNVSPSESPYENITIKNKQGDYFDSTWHFQTQQHYLEKTMQSYPHIQWINATRSGVDLAHTESIPLEKISLKRQYEISSRVHCFIESCQPRQGQALLLTDLQESMERCMPILEELYQCEEQGSPKLAILELYLEEERAYAQILKYLIPYYSSILIREHFEQLGRSVKSSLSLQEMWGIERVSYFYLLKAAQWHLQHMQEVYDSNF